MRFNNNEFQALASAVLTAATPLMDRWIREISTVPLTQFQRKRQVASEPELMQSRQPYTITALNPNRWIIFGDAALNQFVNTGNFNTKAPISAFGSSSFTNKAIELGRSVVAPKNDSVAIGYAAVATKSAYPAAKQFETYIDKWMKQMGNPTNPCAEVTIERTTGPFWNKPDRVEPDLLAKNPTPQWTPVVNQVHDEISMATAIDIPAVKKLETEMQSVKADLETIVTKLDSIGSKKDTVEVNGFTISKTIYF